MYSRKDEYGKEIILTYVDEAYGVLTKKTTF